MSVSILRPYRISNSESHFFAQPGSRRCLCNVSSSQPILRELLCVNHDISQWCFNYGSTPYTASVSLQICLCFFTISHPRVSCQAVAFYIRLASCTSPCPAPCAVCLCHSACGSAVSHQTSHSTPLPRLSIILSIFRPCSHHL